MGIKVLVNKKSFLPRVRGIIVQIIVGITLSGD